MVASRRRVDQGVRTKVAIPRRRFVLGAAGAAAAPGLVLAQSPPHIRVVTVPIDISALPFYALDEGIFKKVGLEVEVSTLGSGAQVVAAVVGGTIDFGSGGTTSIALAHEQGIPLVIVAPAGSYTNAARPHGLVLPPDSPVRTPRDLVGKTIANAGLKTIVDVALRAWLDKNGVDPTSVKLLEMPFGAMTPALAAGRIDAADLEEPFLSGALAAGMRFFANVMDAIAPQWVEGAYFCTADYAKAHPDIVRKFADAMAMAARWGNQHPAEAWKIIDKYSHTTTPPGRRHVLYTEHLRAADFQPMIDASAKYGLLKKVFPARELFAPGFGD